MYIILNELKHCRLIYFVSANRTDLTTWHLPRGCYITVTTIGKYKDTKYGILFLDNYTILEGINDEKIYHFSYECMFCS